ncbi:hypothetical protein CHH92_18415 [Bacillus sonorensis]|uniref:Uncharacterized protein n=1 Tax=Bacillus sonorensis L12 TaxID=1274524 RepID=M5P8J4_9BACI|nr:hypothetical protein BSONL12_05568 [Bacillus sonorensis L12]PAD58817.1 hypothetical protein CHH92_18415 [Bacillus sonorensis]RHJ06654.1 hypothetical protein DW143_19960 [Bacillus sonorensis]
MIRAIGCFYAAAFPDQCPLNAIPAARHGKKMPMDTDMLSLMNISLLFRFRHSQTGEAITSNERPPYQDQAEVFFYSEVDNGVITVYIVYIQ